MPLLCSRPTGSPEVPKRPWPHRAWSRCPPLPAWPCGLCHVALPAPARAGRDCSGQVGGPTPAGQASRPPAAPPSIWVPAATGQSHGIRRVWGGSPAVLRLLGGLSPLRYPRRGGHMGGGSRLCPGASQLRGGGAASRCGEASLCGGWADVWDPKKVRVGEGVAAPGDGTEVEAGVWGAALAACTVTPEPWGVCG